MSVLGIGDWKLIIDKTGSSEGSVGPTAGAYGKLALESPEGDGYLFDYRTAGAGPSVGLKGFGTVMKDMKHLSKLAEWIRKAVRYEKDLSGKGSHNESYAYNTYGCVVPYADKTLTLNSFLGACVKYQIGLAAGYGWSGTILFTGLPNLGYAAAELIPNPVTTLFLPTVKAGIFMSGLSFGAQLNAGITGQIGHVHLRQKLYDRETPDERARREENEAGQRMAQFNVDKSF